jgi:acetyl-CoA carboxylase biotin carboxyl carrier protein
LSEPSTPAHVVSPLDLDLVRMFCEMAEAHDLSGLDVSYKDFHLRVTRGSASTHAPTIVAVPPPVTGAVARPENHVAVESPLAGVFYRAVRPGSPPFVEPGDEVQSGQTLCIIEAMKLMNEILAETHGRVARILVENGQVVEAGQEILWLEPL